MNIVFVGLNGVPYCRRASDIRLKSFANILATKSNSVYILNKFSPIQTEEAEDDNSGNYSIIEDLEKFRNCKGIKLRIIQFISMFTEGFHLLRLNRKINIQIIHVYSGHFFEIIKYFLISRLISAKIIYQYVEFRSEIPRKGFYHVINGLFFDKFSTFLMDGVISISNFITNHIKQVNQSVPIINVPPICNFEFFDNIKPNLIDHNYFLYCGSIGYMENIELILKSYLKSNSIENKISLVLILNGDLKEIMNIRKKYSDNSNIIILNNLAYKSLVNYYKGALGLLIPLRNTIQDLARFPNKICEYTASLGVIITTNYGEIPYFFKDNVNAVIAETYTIDSFSKKMNQVLEKKNDLTLIKTNSYKTGLENFNEKAYSDKLELFLKEISNFK